eukprot:5761059-Prymnesium_polylepis.1
MLCVFASYAQDFDDELNKGSDTRFLAWSPTATTALPRSQVQDWHGRDVHDLHGERPGSFPRQHQVEAQLARTKCSKVCAWRP